jgi:PAS domain-containing protein
MIRYSRSGVRFLYWYSLGLALLAIAMVDLLMLPAVGSLLNWVGRFAQYVAGGYFVVALLSAADDARSRGTQLQDALAEVWGGIGTYWRDIAEPRHEQELLRQSEERFRAIFDQGGIGIALGTLQGMILQTNAAYQGMVGYDADDLTSMNFVQITHPEDLEKELVLWDELVSNKRKAYRMRSATSRRTARLSG